LAGTEFRTSEERKDSLKALFPVSALILCLAASLASAQSVPAATATTLAATSTGTPVTTVVRGTVITLTATVSNAGSPVSPGLVNFCDAAAAHCTDIHLLGTVELVKAGPQAGTATLNFVPGFGSHSYKAVFLGTGADAASSSAVHSLSVTRQAIAKSTTTLTAGGNPGNYTLTATVPDNNEILPTGTVSFQDTTNNNYVLGTATLSPGQAAQTWLNTQSPQTGSYPLGVAVGDFNEDGRLDLATANDVSDSLTVLLGNGDGTFNLASTPTGVYSPFSLVVGDFNGDGIPDVAAAGFYSSRVTVLLGNGDGTFNQVPDNFDTDQGPRSMTVADFNGDGILDLATSNFVGNTVTILLGNGDGTFAATALNPPAGAGPTSIAAGDFNGDGIPDLAVANENGNSVSVLLGNGDGTFTAAPTIAVGNSPKSIVVADFNGDGKADLAVANFVDDTVTILLGNGNGTFAATPATPTTGDAPSALAVGDFFGSGIPDLAAANFYGATVTVLLGNGDGTFTPGASPETGTDAWSIASGDFNGDGLTDLAVGNLVRNDVTVLLALDTVPAIATVTGISPVGTGIHWVDAVYSGDTNYLGSVSLAIPLTAEPVTTTLSLTAVPNTITYGQNVLLTATLGPTNPAVTQNHTATGSVTFMNGATSLGTGTLNAGGIATLNTTTLPQGVDNITAVYPGDTNFAPATSAAAPVTVIGIVTTTTLTVSATSLTAGQSLTLTATVAAASGATPTGAVTFYDGLASLGTGTLNAAGVATLTLTPAAGVYSITASYGGNVANASSVSSAIAVTVSGGTATSPNIYLYAGNGTAGYAGDGGPAVDAELNLPHGVVSDAAGNIYYADGNENVVRKIVRATNQIATVAGTGAAGYSGDGGQATAAVLNNPYDVALDAAGNLYIADAWNACVRKVDLKTGGISTFAGICTQLGESGNNGPATQAEMILPLGVAVDPSGNVFITDAGLSLVHEVNAATGIMTIFAGKIDATQLGDGGPATEAQIQYAIGIATDPTGNVYIVDSNANRVRKVTAATGIITTVAGTGNFGYGVNGILATESDLAQPNDVACDAAGNIYFSDSSSGRVRRVDAVTGLISEYAGDGTAGYSGDGGPAIDAEMNYPEGLWFDAAGNLYIADSFNNRIRVVGAPPNVTIIATTTMLTASATSLTPGQTLTLTATVTAMSGATPTGTVTFYNGIASLGTGTLNAAGVATLALTPAVGTYSITASYGGSTTDAPSISSPPIQVNVALIPTTTTLTAVPNPVLSGQTVTFTATVTAANGVVPIGTVTVTTKGLPTVTQPLVNGVATFVFTTGTPGTYTFTANYPGSATDGPSSATVQVIVTAPSTTTTTLMAAPTALYVGQTLTLTAAVTASAGAKPTGTVNFFNGAASLGSGTLSAAGVATLTLTPPAGVYSITASYAGNANDLPSASSPPITITVSIPATTTALTASPNPAPFGTGVTFTATVSAAFGTPTGPVSFYDGTTLLGTGTMAAGVATYSTSALAVGSHNITAQFASTAAFGGSTSNGVVEVITLPTFSLSATPPSVTLYTGESATYAVTVTPGTGFNLPVVLTCGPLPAATTCTFSPATVNGGAWTSTLVVQTTAPGPPATTSSLSRGSRLTALAGLLLLLIPRRWRRFRGRWQLWITIFVSLAAATAISACGGPVALFGGTPVGPQTISVNGTITYDSQTLTNSTTVTLNVQSLF